MVLTPLGAVLLLIVGVFHTGWCYSLFFGSMTYLPAQTVVLFSYIDPIVAIFLSALLLKEPLGWSGILGAVLVLGSTPYQRTARPGRCRKPNKLSGGSQPAGGTMYDLHSILTN